MKYQSYFMEVNDERDIWSNTDLLLQKDIEYTIQVCNVGIVSLKKNEKDTYTIDMKETGGIFETHNEESYLEYITYIRHVEGNEGRENSE